MNTRVTDACRLTTLYADLYDRIVGDDHRVHRGLLVVRKYVETLTLDRRMAIMIRCGFSVKITSFYIEWLLHGECHRVDGPAVVTVNGTRIWRRHGQLHRVDGPAIEHADGYCAWYWNDNRHRTDGPAIERADGYRAWCQNGLYHRTDGPAVEGADGTREWWLNDVRQPDQ